MNNVFKNIIKIVAIILLSLYCFSQEQKGTIKIEVNGFVSDEGVARILVFSTKEKEYFPSEQNKAMIKKIVPIKKKQVIYEIKDLPYGDYAISVHHDRNNDGKVNKNLIGLPNEGLGCTKDAKGFFGPPSFNKAKITLKSDMYYAIINLVN